MTTTVEALAARAVGVALGIPPDGTGLIGGPGLMPYGFLMYRYRGGGKTSVHKKPTTKGADRWT